MLAAAARLAHRLLRYANLPCLTPRASLQPSLELLVRLVPVLVEEAQASTGAVVVRALRRDQLVAGIFRRASKEIQALISGRLYLAESEYRMWVRKCSTNHGHRLLVRLALRPPIIKLPRLPWGRLSFKECHAKAKKPAGHCYEYGYDTYRNYLHDM